MNKNEIFELVKKTIVDTVPDTPEDKILQHTSLSELGIDSIKIVELGVRLEEIFGEAVILDDWLDNEVEKDPDNAYNIDTLVKYIDGAIA